MKVEEKTLVEQYSIVREKEVMKIFGVSRDTLNRWVKIGDFPKPIKLGPRSKGWLAVDIDTYVRSKRQSA